MVVIYNSAVVLTKKCVYYNYRIVIYARGADIRFATGLASAALYQRVNIN